ncbi:MAG: GerAB/ArcD/ProY family transporter [Christensenellales bacterium]|jgi:spore germination protein KB
MRKKPIITSVQLALMAVGSALVFPYSFLPIMTSPPANQDMWIVLLISFVYLLVFNAPVLFLVNRFRGMNAVEMVETTMGKVLGKALLIPYVLFFLYCFTACMLITAVFINIYIFPETPTWGLLIFMIVPICYAAYKGAGTIGRLATFIVPFILLTIVFFPVFESDKMDFRVLQPVLADSTFLELNEGAFFTAARYSEILIFWVFSYYLGQKISINKTYAVALIVFGIAFSLILIPTMLVLGVEFAKHLWNPYYVFTRQVEIFDFIERASSLNALSWFPVAVLKLTIYNYMASYVFAGMINAKTHKNFVIPFSIIAFIICLLPVMDKSSTIEMLRSDRIFPFVILPVVFIIPLIVIITYFIRRKKIDPILCIKNPSSSESK